MKDWIAMIFSGLIICIILALERFLSVIYVLAIF